MASKELNNKITISSGKRRNPLSSCYCAWNKESKPMLILGMQNEGIFKWEIGDALPIDKDLVSNVISVLATGNELAYIRDTMINLPFVNKKVVKWHEPFAQFIVVNL